MYTYTYIYIYRYTSYTYKFYTFTYMHLYAILTLLQFSTDQQRIHCMGRIREIFVRESFVRVRGETAAWDDVCTHTLSLTHTRTHSLSPTHTRTHAHAYTYVKALTYRRRHPRMYAHTHAQHTRPCLRLISQQGACLFVSRTHVLS